MALAGRKLREIKVQKSHMFLDKNFSGFLLFLRKILAMIIFRNCWICTTKLDFWKPFIYAISYPYNDTINLETNEVKIGFVFFWFYLSKIDMLLNDYLYPLHLKYINPPNRMKNLNFFYPR